MFLESYANIISFYILLHTVLLYIIYAVLYILLNPYAVPNIIQKTKIIDEIKKI